MIALTSLVGVLKIVMLVSILFVWVVRYQNIVEEFKKYNYPGWLRDTTGILKISCVFMLFSPDKAIVLVGSSGILLLMTAALITHLRIKNPVQKMIPAVSMLGFSTLVFANSI